MDRTGSTESSPATKHDRTPEAAKAQPRGRAEERRRRRTILAVDDDDDVRALVIDVLQGLGYAVLAAANGRQALEMLRDAPEVDLLFTDLVMPGGLSGTELVHLARGLRPDLKVLLTSGYVGHRMLAARPMDEAEAFLPKPYRPAVLAHRIRALLGG